MRNVGTGLSATGTPEHYWRLTFVAAGFACVSSILGAAQGLVLPAPEEIMSRPMMPGALHPLAGEPGFVALAIQARAPMGIELIPGQSAVSGSIEVDNGAKFAGVLERINYSNQEYHPIKIAGVINVGPSTLLHDRRAPLNRELGPLSVASMRLGDVIVELRRRLDSQYRPTSPTIGGPASARPTLDEILNHPVTLAVPNATVRDVLNTLIKIFPQFAWVVRYDESSVDEHSCVIEIVSFAGARAAFLPRRLFD